MFREGELERIRDAANTLLPSVCRIGRSSRTHDGGGGYSTFYDYSGADVACRLGVFGSVLDREARSGDRIDDRTTHVLTLPADTTIESDWRVKVEGIEYEVTGIRRRPGAEMIRRVEVREVS